MEIDKLKKKIEMKTLLEDEIKEQMKKLAEKGKEILIKNDEIFNSSSSEPVISEKYITFTLYCDVDYELLKELKDELKPDKLCVTGGGHQGLFSGQSSQGYVTIKLLFG